MDNTHEQFESLVRDLVPINSLPVQYQTEIINQSSVEKFRKRQFVFRQGDRDNWSYFLLSGDLDLVADEQLVKQIRGQTDAARYALSQLQPRQMSARATSAVSVLKVDRHLLDKLLTLDDKGEGGEVEVAEIDSEESMDWMTRLLQSELFARIPPANIQRIFTTMESVEVKAGEVIVEQGSPGDYYYLIQSGRCEVVRRTASGREPIKLAELRDGDSFGEEALVSNAVRNASIIMLTDGELKRLTKEDFVDLIKKPVLNSVSYLKAESLVAGGAKWLDVRFAEEHQDSGIEGSLNIPMNVLRAKLDELDPATSYVLYCDTGGRSSIAAFLLTQNGFDVSFLEDGLIKSPIGIQPKTPAPKPAVPGKPKAPAAAVEPSAKAGASGAKKTEQKQPAKQPEAKATPASPKPVSAAQEKPADDELVEPLSADIRANALGAELAKANIQLEEALRHKTEAEAAKKSAEADKAGVALQRAKLEAEAAKLKEEAETARRRLEQAAKGQIQQERERLEAEAAKLKEEAEAARREAEAFAEQRIQQEREKLERKSQEASQALAEAQRIRLELERAKEAAEQEVVGKRVAEEARLNALRLEAEERLRVESKKLEEEYAKNAEALAKARAEREEAEKRLRDERALLDVQADEARQKLEEARLMKQETEASRRAAELDVERKKQIQEALERKMRDEVNKKIQDERKKLMAEFARQAEEMEEIRRESEAAERARLAAKEEADRIIEEYKAEHAKALQEQELRLQREKERLAAETEQVREALISAREAKQEAENSRKLAEQRMQALEAEADKAVRAGEAAQLRAEIEAMDAEVNQARERLQEAEEAQDAAVAAQEANEENIVRQQSVEDELRRQLAEEALQWKSAHDAKEEELERAHDFVIEKEQIERIKRRAAEAKKAAKVADDDLLGDIASQLNSGDLN